MKACASLATPDGPATGLTVYAFTVDPQLGRIDTPNGSVTFLQAFGVTPAKKQEMVKSSTAAVLERLATTNPLLVTDRPARDNHLMASPAGAAELDLQLVALFPQQFRLDRREGREDDREYVSIPTFPTLVKLLRGLDNLDGALEAPLCSSGIVTP